MANVVLSQNQLLRSENDLAKNATGLTDPEICAVVRQACWFFIYLPLDEYTYYNMCRKTVQDLECKV